MRMSTILGVLMAVGLPGCAVKLDWVAAGGSRADGTIELAYEAGDLQKAELDEVQGTAVASNRCSVWGYSGAEPFGAVTRKCIVMTGFGCARWQYTKKYQCLGTGSGPSTPK